MEIVLCCFIAIVLLCLLKIWHLEYKQINLKYYKELAEQLEIDKDLFKRKAQWLEYQNELLKQAVQLNERAKRGTKEIPKGTIQAVKEAMKRSHPDNGGNAEDFQMYRRAYNVLTGKEKL